MKCIECGSINEYGHKFCGQCGIKLPEKPQESVNSNDGEEQEEAKVSEELIDLWKLYESGDLDGAAEKGKVFIKTAPNSSSAHSVVALVFERKAKVHYSDGDFEECRKSLEEAIYHYEEIIRLNPHSAADKAKLSGLKIKLTGEAPVIQRNKYIGIIAKYLEIIPKPILAASATFIVVLLIAFLMYSLGERKKTSGQVVGDLNTVQSSPNQAQQTPQSTYPQQRATKIYTFPMPAPRVSPAMPQQGANQAVGTRQNNPVPRIIKPYALPSIGTSDSSTPKGSTNINKNTNPTASPQQNTNSNNNVQQSNVDEAQSMFARALDFKNQGKKELAKASAQKAIELYQLELQSGKNSDVCTLGIKNAERLIELLGESN